jgi:tight adherence protein B
MPEITQLHIVYILVGLSAALIAEAAYLVLFTGRSYRKTINHRLRVADKATSQTAVLTQLRRERGLTADGQYQLPILSLNQLLLQSGVKLGFMRCAALAVMTAIAGFAGAVFLGWPLPRAALAGLFCLVPLPLLVLKVLRGMRQKKFSAQFPDAIDMIVRSLRAGHPVPIAISLVAREMPDPVGTEFGIVADEITYGSDLETAMRDLYFRVGAEDLPLFVTAVAIQSSTGGNLGEILENLSGVIRQRFKVRRKIRALAAEGRMSAIILSSLPIAIFLAVQILTPSFYASVWHVPLTKLCLMLAGGWMAVGNVIMYRMVNFKV